MESHATVALPASWVDARDFDSALTLANDPLVTLPEKVTVAVPAGCKVMVDAALKILCFAHQLRDRGASVAIKFEDGHDGAMGYLNRIGFFDMLDSAVEILPDRPVVSGAVVYRGMNDNLVEIAALRSVARDKDLPARLSDALKNSVASGKAAAKLGRAAFTVFAELIQNVYLHSGSALDGYATLQVYKGGKKAKVVVSDNGVGIIETLRPTLPAKYGKMSDSAVVFEAFQKGLSRHGPGRGCGLKASADHAIKYQAELDVRLPKCRVHLVPSASGYQPHVAFCSDSLPLLHGTHICFDFMFDK